MKKMMMMFVVLCFVVHATAQDIVTLKTGEEIEAKVEEIGKTDVWYKKYSNPDGPVYSLPKTDIFMIKYQNGEKDVFSAVSSEEPGRVIVKKKEPWVSCILSCVIPGLGQMYNGEYAKGAIMGGLWLGSIVGMVTAVNESYFDHDHLGYYRERDYSGLAAASLLVFLGNGIWSIIDAPISSNKINRKNGALSWQVGKNSCLSVKPDLSMTTHTPMGNTLWTPSYGARLSLNF